MPPVYLPSGATKFPPLSHTTEDGLLAIGGELTRASLIQAYRNGIFPWYDDDSPILWWAPPIRGMMRPDELHIPHSLRRVINARRFSVTLDTAFASVITRCAASSRPGQFGTWIVQDMRKAYIDLHRAGFAHSVEAWLDGELAGGLYGVSLGGAFFGESMFFRKPDASKVAFVWLARLLEAWGFTLIDCQQVTDNLVRFGAYGVERDFFMQALGDALIPPDRVGTWVMPKDFFPL